MVNTEKQSFWNMMNVCCELYKRPALSKEAVSIWWSKLEKYNFNIVSRAFDKWSTDNSFMPTPHDIIELCKTQQERVFNQKITKKLSEDELAANRERIKDIINGLGRRKLA